MTHNELADYVSQQLSEARAKLRGQLIEAMYPPLPADYVPPPPPHPAEVLRRTLNQQIYDARTELALKIAPWLETDEYDDY